MIIIYKKSSVKLIFSNKVCRVADKMSNPKIIIKLLSTFKNKRCFYKNQNKTAKTFNRKNLKILFMNKNNNQILLRSQQFKILLTNKVVKNLFIIIKRNIHMKIQLINKISKNNKNNKKKIIMKV